MQIHELKNPQKKMRKRIGRGGKRGTTAGRGTKGQKSRSGVSMKPLFEGGRTSLVMRLKKNRGFKSPHAGQKALSLSTLEKHFENDETVNIVSLKEKKLIRTKDAKSGVRILAGTLNKKLKIEHEIGVSKNAKEIIEKAGGKILEEIKKPDLKARKVPISK